MSIHREIDENNDNDEIKTSHFSVKTSSGENFQLPWNPCTHRTLTPSQYIQYLSNHHPDMRFLKSQLHSMMNQSDVIKKQLFESTLEQYYDEQEESQCTKLSSNNDDDDDDDDDDNKNKTPVSSLLSHIVCSKHAKVIIIIYKTFRDLYLSLQKMSDKADEKLSNIPHDNIIRIEFTSLEKLKTSVINVSNDVDLDYSQLSRTDFLFCLASWDELHNIRDDWKNQFVVHYQTIFECIPKKCFATSNIPLSLLSRPPYAPSVKSTPNTPTSRLNLQMTKLAADISLSSTNMIRTSHKPTIDDSSQLTLMHNKPISLTNVSCYTDSKIMIPYREIDDSPGEKTLLESTMQIMMNFIKHSKQVETDQWKYGHTVFKFDCRLTSTQFEITTNESEINVDKYMTEWNVYAKETVTTSKQRMFLIQQIQRFDSHLASKKHLSIFLFQWNHLPNQPRYLFSLFRS
jgi:hypothetical protein